MHCFFRKNIFSMKQKLAISIFFLGVFLPFFPVSAGTIIDSHKYAWGDNIGYINFENVTVDDGALGGYAWSENKGFLKFNPVLGGVSNDGAGNLSGSAWGEQLGWIDFGNVVIGPDGKFSGTATGALAGTITFDCRYCDVQTDWRQAGGNGSLPAAAPSGGQISGGRSIAPVSVPAGVEPVQESAESAKARLIDIQKDGVIGILDFNAMMVNWGNTACGNPADTDNDCNVGILDFNTLMVYWGNTYQT